MRKRPRGLPAGAGEAYYSKRTYCLGRNPTATRVRLATSSASSSGQRSLADMVITWPTSPLRVDLVIKTGCPPCLCSQRVIVSSGSSLLKIRRASSALSASIAIILSGKLSGPRRGQRMSIRGRVLNTSLNGRSVVLSFPSGKSQRSPLSPSGIRP